MKNKVAIIMGSSSDLETMQSAAHILKQFEIPFDVKIMSAHRTPAKVADWSKHAYSNGYRAIIAAAGMSAHLAGVIAAHTVVPVLGVPMPGGHLDGMDALLSTVNMPGGVPVLTLGIGKSGATNAALAAAQIFATVGNDDRIMLCVSQYRDRMNDDIENINKAHGFA